MSANYVTFDTSFLPEVHYLSTFAAAQSHNSETLLTANLVQFGLFYCIYILEKNLAHLKHLFNILTMYDVFVLAATSSLSLYVNRTGRFYYIEELKCRQISTIIVDYVSFHSINVSVNNERVQLFHG